ncbi:MAG: phosphotransacetylase family protein [Chloroflexi bacterium]|nr:phosphotransacetylase family protein [Chloroflexota bacterium]
MAVLYVAANTKGAGKTALASALAWRLRSEGKRVAVVKPLRILPRGEVLPSEDPDIAYYQRLLPGSAAPEGWPVVRSGEQAAAVEPEKLLSEAWPKLLQDNDVVLVEGLDGLDPADPVAQLSARLAQATGARAVVVVGYTPSLQAAEVRATKALFGERLFGVLLNQVRCYRKQQVSTQLIPAVQAEGVQVLGAVPEDRGMLAVTVGQIAQLLDGEVRLLPEKGDALAESFMVGGWFLDQGAYVFSKRENKAVVVRADRPDLQMAALETSTVCLVLTGGVEPVQYSVYHAQQRGVPLVMTKAKTLEALERLANVADLATVHHPAKAERFARLLEQHRALKGLYAALGIAEPVASPLDKARVH